MMLRAREGMKSRQATRSRDPGESSCRRSAYSGAGGGSPELTEATAAVVRCGELFVASPQWLRAILPTL